MKGQLTRIKRLEQAGGHKRHFGLVDTSGLSEAEAARVIAQARADSLSGHVIDLKDWNPPTEKESA